MQSVLHFAPFTYIYVTNQKLDNIIIISEYLLGDIYGKRKF